MAAKKRKKLKMKRENEHDFQVKNRKPAPGLVNFPAFFAAMSLFSVCGTLSSILA
jgi:hypothetical protein